MDEAPKEYPDDPETQEWMNAPMGRMKSAPENQPELTDFLAALQTWTTQHWKNLPRDARRDWGWNVAGPYAALCRFYKGDGTTTVAVGPDAPESAKTPAKNGAENGWSPSPEPFDGPVVVSRCSPYDTIPAEPVRESDSASCHESELRKVVRRMLPYLRGLARATEGADSTLSIVGRTQTSGFTVTFEEIRAWARDLETALESKE